MRYDQARQTLLHGAGSIDALRDELADIHVESVALVTSPSAAASVGYAALRDALGDLRIVREFREVRSHAPVEDSERLATELAADPPDAIVAYGGGSASDTAKAISIVLAEGLPLTDHCSTFTPPADLVHAQLDAPKIPVISVPTTLSGAEVTPGGGATDPQRVKRVFWDHRVASRILVFDPLALQGVPREVVLTTGMNGLAHCAEALYSRSATAISDTLAVEGARRFGAALPAFAHDQSDPETLDDLLLAAYLGGLVISNARVGLHHAVCHVLGASLGLSHGTANTVMLPYVLEFNADETAAKQRLLAGALAITNTEPADAALAAPALVRRLQERCGLPTNLADVGVQEEELDEVARLVMQDRGLYFNPKRVTDTAAVRALLENAWTGTLGATA